MPKAHARRPFFLLFSVGVVIPLVMLPLWSMAQARRSPRRTTSGAMLAPEERVVPDTPANRALVKAARRMDLKAVREAFAAGASADTALGTVGRPETMPVAILAAYAETGQEAKARPVFREIVGRVKDVNAEAGPFRNTLLMVAAELEDLPSVRSLVERGARLDAHTGAMPGSMGMDGKMIPGGRETVLHRAISVGGDLRKDVTPVLTYLLDKGAPVNEPDARDVTPLMLAAQYGKAPVVQALLAHGADPARRDLSGRTALDYATRRRFAEVAALLDAKTAMDLGQAATFGNVERIRAALKAGADPNALDERKRPALVAAVTSGRVEAVQALLDAGAQVGASDKQGLTALHVAAQAGEPTILKALIAHKADPDALAKPHGLRGEPATPLMEAVDQARPEAVDLLLRHVDPKAHGQLDAALRLAIATAGMVPSTPSGLPRQRRDANEFLNANGRILEALLRAGADPRADESRALFLAAENGQTGLVRLLLDKGASVNAQDRDRYALEPGATALIAAVNAVGMAGGEEEMIRDGSMSGMITIADAQAEQRNARATFDLLLRRGADIDLADAQGKTPLMHCVEMDAPSLVSALLARKPRLEAADREGRTVLALAAAEGKLSLVRTLVAAGAKIGAVDAKGRTVLMLAIDAGQNAEYRQRRAEMDRHMEGHGESPRPIRRDELPNRTGRPELVRFLLSHGANPKVMAKDGVTALSLAQKEAFAEVAAMLRNR